MLGMVEGISRPTGYVTTDLKGKGECCMLGLGRIHTHVRLIDR
jgi:hypothetical protein